jgi:hypothetical protein
MKRILAATLLTFATAAAAVANSAPDGYRRGQAVKSSGAKAE